VSETDRELPVRVVRDVQLRDRRLTSKQRNGAGDTRSEARRDKDRIFYSVSWRRLAGVTQVVTPFEDIALMHNRLTHSEKVAQVSRSIAERLVSETRYHDLLAHLGGVDPDVAETAALAHDLGHPPFGHIGEETLDDLARGPLKLADGFEGNAQTFRTALLTETRHVDYDGFDLTCASLAATAKYPWLRARTLHDSVHEESLDTDGEYRRHWRKFSVYKPEEAAFQQCREFIFASGAGESFPLEAQSLEASIMDAADDITYAVHDLEDFYLAGILNVRAILDEFEDPQSSRLSALQDRLALDYPAYFDQSEFERAIQTVKEELRLGLLADYAGDLHSTGLVHGMGSEMIGRYIKSIGAFEQQIWPGGPFIGLAKREWHEVQLLKEVTRSFVVTRPDIALLQRGQQQVLRRLVAYLLEWKEAPKDFKRLPRRLRDEIEIARRQADGDTSITTGYEKHDNARPFAPRGAENRCILDYICSLTDGLCYSLSEKLDGRRPATSSMEIFF